MRVALLLLRASSMTLDYHGDTLFRRE